MSGVNVPLLRKAVEWAEAEAAKPRELSQWEQNFWTLSPEDRARRVEVAQIAGTSIEAYRGEDAAAYQKSPECGTCYCIAGYVTQEVHGAMVRGYENETIATDILGLSEDQANALFDGTNSIEDVRRIAEKIAGERL